MTILDYSAILLFAAGVLVAGLSFSGKQKDILTFFSAGGSVPWGISGLSLFMGFFSAGTFVVWGAIGYRHGLVAITIQETMCLAGLLVGAFIAPKWHRTRSLTAAEYITARFGMRTQKTYTILFLFVSLFTTGAFLYPVAKILSVSTGLDISTCVLVFGLFCVLYVSFGGLWSVVITDVLQFIILTSAIIIVVPLSVMRVGGLSCFVELAPENFFSPVNESFPWTFIVAFGIYNAIFIGGNWAYVQRYTSVRTESDSKKVGFLFSTLYLICPILWMLPAMIFRIINGSLLGAEDEGAFLMMCKEVLPSGIMGMMIGGMIFATASSFNATVNISSGVFTNDIFKNVVRDAKDRTLVRVARISSLVFGFLAIVVALLIPRMGGIVNVVISVAALTGVPLYLPIIWSLYSRYQTKTTVVFCTALCLAVNLIFKFIVPVISGFSLDRTGEMVLGVSLPVVIMLLTEIVFRLKKRPDSGYYEYEGFLSVKKKNLSESSQNENRYGIKVIGGGAMIAGLIQCILGLLISCNNILVITRTNQTFGVARGCYENPAGRSWNTLL